MCYLSIAVFFLVLYFIIAFLDSSNMSKQFRVCASLDCKIRLPDLAYDGHTKCSGCIGKVCSLEDRCVECKDWPSDVFDKFVKHRHQLELNKVRKAKQRSKAKQLILEREAGSDQQVLAVAAHSVSPSPPCSVINVSSASSVSAYSPTTAPISLPITPTAESSAPRDQVVTRNEFDSLKSIMLTIASDLAAMKKDRVKDSVHSESVPPPTQSLPQTSVVDTGDVDPSVNPMLLPLVRGGEAPEGGFCPTLACPVVNPESLGLAVERGRKRFREFKDLPVREKRLTPTQ